MDFIIYLFCSAAVLRTFTITIFILVVIITTKGLSLLRGCLDELPKEGKAMIAGDMGELKRELREKVMRMLMIMNGTVSNI